MSKFGSLGLESKLDPNSGKDWPAIRQTLQTIIPVANSPQSPAKDNDGKSTFEAQSHSITRCSESWSQFKTEVRENKFSTSAGVKEMLRLRHLEQQKHVDVASAERNDITSEDVHPHIKERSMSLITLLKQTRFSESDAVSSSAIQRRFSRRASSTELSSKLSKNESFSNFFECVGEDNTRNYRQAIRGNTHSFLSLYDSTDQDNKSPSSKWMAALNPMKVRESDFSSRNGSRRASSKTASLSSFDESFEFIDLEEHGSDIFECISEDENEDTHQSMQECSQDNMLVRGCALSQSLERIESKLDILGPVNSLNRDRRVTTDDDDTTATTNKASEISLNRDESHPQGNNESSQEELCFNQQEEAEGCNSSDDDDKRNNGCFEFCSEARQRAFEKTGVVYGQRPSAIANQSNKPSSYGSTLLLCWNGNAESSLLVHWNESGR